MRYTKSSWLILALVLTLILSACNLGQEPEPTPDVGVIFTAAAETVMAQFSLELTQTALAAPTATQMPTNTPPTSFAVVSPGAESPVAPALTPIATFGAGTQPTSVISLPTITSVAVLPTQSGPLCDDYILANETVPDGTVFKPGEDFVKTFTLQNTGTCRWDEGYSFEYLGGTLDGYTIKLKKSQDFVDPGSSITFKLDLTASVQQQTYTDCWRMKNDGGYYFGPYPVCVVIEVKK